MELFRTNLLLIPIQSLCISGVINLLINLIEPFNDITNIEILTNSCPFRTKMSPFVLETFLSN